MTTIGISGVEGFARAARELYAAPNERELLWLAVDLAVRTINGSDHAGICVVQGRELSTPIAFDDVMRRGDALQYQLHEGPCLDAVRWQETVISPESERGGSVARVDPTRCVRLRHQSDHVALALHEP